MRTVPAEGTFGSTGEMVDMGIPGARGRRASGVRQAVGAALTVTLVVALAGCDTGTTRSQLKTAPSCTTVVKGPGGVDVEVKTEYGEANPESCKPTDEDIPAGPTDGDDATDATPDDGATSDAAASNDGGGDATDQAAFQAPDQQTPTAGQQPATPNQQPATQQPATPSPTPAAGGTDTPTAEKPTATTQKPSATTEKPSATTEKPTATTQKPSATTEKPPVTTEKPTATTQKPVTIANSEWVMDLRPDPSSSGNSGKFNVRFKVDAGTVSGGQYESNLEATLLFSGTINPDGSTTDLKALAGNNNNPTQKGTYYFEPATLKTPGDPKTIEGRYRHEIGNTTYTGSVVFTKRS